jgi:hypothetical protein
MDGQGFGAFLKIVFGDNDSIDGLPSIPSLGFCGWFVIYLVTPCCLVYEICKAAMKPKDHNLIKDSEIMCTGKKAGAFSREISVEVIKKTSKSLGCTVNDLLTALLNQTLTEYFVNNQDKSKEFRDGQVPQSIGVCVPWSVREPAPLDKVKFTN